MERPADRAARLAAGAADRKGGLAKRPPDRTRGALFFHNASIATPWLRQRERTVRIGQHIFYR